MSLEQTINGLFSKPLRNVQNNNMNELQALLTHIYELSRKAPATAEDHQITQNVYQRLFQELQTKQEEVTNEVS